ncbi:protein-disulfide reductase DsbD [Bordetella genomosp. 9]|nr:protein-disulfide reductase DsbD [Bordetella genomosp. 9]
MPFAFAPLAWPRHRCPPDRAACRVWIQAARTLALFCLCLFAGISGARAEDDFLAPEQAFPFSASVDGPDAIRVVYKVARGYYMYRERFAFAVAPAGAATLGQPIFPAGEVKYDPTFDKNMEVYHGPVSIRVPVQPGGGPFTLKVTGQGCADKGVCYPPMTHTVSLQPSANGLRITGTGTADFSPTDYPAPTAGAAFSAAPAGIAGLTGGQPAGAAGSSSSQGADGAAPNAPTPALAPSSGDPSSVARQDRPAAGGIGALVRTDDIGLADAIAGMGWLKTAGVFLLLGVLLSLTPCVLPMIPILSSLIVGAGQGHGRERSVTRSRGLALAAAYVLGMSLVYTGLGVAAGLSGVGLAAWLQTPWVLALFAALLGVLALAMFDVFTLQVPAALQTRLSDRVSRVPGGRATGAFVMGAVSALIVGPCVAAPLAGALLYISQTGDVVLGGAALFAMAWGMGVPLLIVGASAGSLLPKAGPWMDGVKRLFGMLLLGTAWWMLIPLLPVWVQMVGWALLALVAAVMLRAFEPLPTVGGTARMFAKGAGLLLALIAVVLLVGAASGGRDVLRPLSQLAAADRGWTNAGTAGSENAGKPGAGSFSATPIAPAALTFTPVRSLAELDAAVASAGRPAMLDFYADWCVSCREMEQFTFTDPAVAARMSGMLLLRADVTANNADDRALLKRFRLFGPPGIIFFDAQGRERRDVRVIGFQEARRFAESLDRVATPQASR